MKKILIIPMSATAETAGPASRTNLLVNYLKDKKINVSTCCAKDINYKPIQGIKNYELSIPTPLGMPKIIGNYFFPIVQKLGLTSKKSIHNFEEVLHLTGNINYKYLKKSINEIRKAIKEFEPDIIYSEFNISAIIAAKLENKKLFISASYPTQYDKNTKSKHKRQVNKILKELNLPTVNSTLELFDWADKKFIPSCHKLEPFQSKKVIFCGAWKNITPKEKNKKNKILVYMGNGTISQRKMVKEITKAFQNTKYEIYIAGKNLKKQENKNIHIDKRFNFQELFPSTILFINHGGQNSMTDALIYGIPQIICPGKIFERKYNAESIEKNKAGITLSHKKFKAKQIKETANTIIKNSEYKNNAQKIGKELLSLGGIENIIKNI